MDSYIWIIIIGIIIDLILSICVLRYASSKGYNGIIIGLMAFFTGSLLIAFIMALMPCVEDRDHLLSEDEKGE